MYETTVFKTFDIRLPWAVIPKRQDINEVIPTIAADYSLVSFQAMAWREGTQVQPDRFT